MSTNHAVFDIGKVLREIPDYDDNPGMMVRCSENDFYDPEKGLAMAIIKKIFGNDNSFHKIFKKWVPEE